VKWPLVICVALGVTGCGDQELKKLSRIRDTICDCKTVKCAETALEGVPKGTVESNPKSQRIAREMMNCLAELYELDRPTLDPDAETSGH
jgi:hypothetical protein